MSLVLTVAGARWRNHLRSVADATAGLVPVAKGNGYGFGLASLARRCEWLGVDVMAVGTYAELPSVLSRFPGDVLVLTPWRPWIPVLSPEVAGRVIHTVSRPEDLEALLEVQPGARVVLERTTSMRRHGMSAAELWAAAGIARSRARFEGVTIHLPMTGGNEPEARALLDDVIGAEASSVWISHLTPSELERLRSAYGDLSIRPRVGTGLWLGDRGALAVTAVVQDVHPIRRSERFGYRQGRGASGHLLVVSGGTAHGLGLVAPSGDSSPRGRAATLAKGAIESAGTLRSPFSLDGKPLEFAEPPHMQASMLVLPKGARVPEVGDTVDVAVRFTTTTFDEIRL
ncbi:alanine racemase [Nocardioides sp. Kera G14]|uniref:alanine racemase n=1 Tax=Nocardioides sp. Kera G14 TaxID=2884264 RepID=UPI001D0FF05D|nr:alanine racemase [Nocardioides sp. Kera G14]UDY23558.1 alanine racemase [Nocardioides sp. Kera G14]